jgi:alpha-ribazole phosphatase/probable phosphoglycerate mutase
MPVKITYFVHSTTLDNERNIATGWAPGRLSSLGAKQSRELKLFISHIKFNDIYCSDLKRAVDTAEIVFKDEYDIIKDKRLRECNYGDFTRKKIEKFKNRIEDFIHKPFPNGESYKDVEKRIKNFIDFMKEKHEGEHIAIISHQAPQLALEVIIKNKTWKQAIKKDWRKTDAWKPGWEYIIK